MISAVAIVAPPSLRMRHEGRYGADKDVRAGKIARFFGFGPAVAARPTSVEGHVRQFAAGADAKLAEHVAQVEVNGARAEEQLRRGIPVR